MKPQVLILGGGFGGILVAQGLRKANAQITLVDRMNHHLFQPLLYQVATAGLSPADIAAPIRSILSSQENVEVIMAEVTGIDAQKKVVLAGGREIHYDILVVATGAHYNYFGHSDWPKYALSLKSVSDATRIRTQILLAFEAAEMELDPEKRKALLTFVLVGAGPTGVEMAGSIAELAHQALRSDFRHIDPRSTRILLIEAGSRILASFPATLADKAAKKLRALGVEIQNNTRVNQVDAEGVIVSGQRVLAKTVIWSAGVVASPVAGMIGAEVDRVGRVKVNDRLEVPGRTGVFVIGDAACVMQGDNPLPGVAPVAMQEGRYVAKLIKSRLKNNRAGKSEAPFRYLDKGNLATVGRTFAVADFWGMKLSGLIAWFFWVVVHIYYLIGFRNRAVVLMEWMWAYLTFQRGARLITTECPESVNNS